MSVCLFVCMYVNTITHELSDMSPRNFHGIKLHSKCSESDLYLSPLINARQKEIDIRQTHAKSQTDRHTYRLLYIINGFISHDVFAVNIAHVTGHRCRYRFFNLHTIIHSLFTNKWPAAAAQTARSHCKVLSTQYVYYFRAYQRQWNGRQIIR